MGERENGDRIRGGIRGGRDCGRARVLIFHVSVNAAKVEKENVKEALKV